MNEWTIVLGFAAQKDLWAFPWDRDREVGGVVMGRFETSGIDRRDTGAHLFIRRIFASDRGGDHESVLIDYDAVHDLQTIPIKSRPGSPGGRFGADDPGLIVGGVHSHPGIDRQRELSESTFRVRQRTRATLSRHLIGFDETTNTPVVVTPGFNVNAVPAVTCRSVRPDSGHVFRLTGVLTPAASR